MRLKSLKMAGFKSFANPTTLSFKYDITAIVGPNGCGKSNVIDAIRWVLGETSAKQLRGGAMSDVIFAGTDGRTAKSVASVELTFEHTQDEKTGIRHALNIYHELTLRRQVTLDGKSDYFINGTRVRRRDVVDVFLGTGLGARSYAVIEQGMIGKIIDADGAKLRAFVEEAAGVLRYQVRKEETQKQLMQATDNLTRLHDLSDELYKNQKVLERQAKSAQIYEELQAKLGWVQNQLLVARLYEAYKEQTNAKLKQEEAYRHIQALSGKMATSKERGERLQAQINEILQQKDDAQTQLNHLTLLAKDAEHDHLRTVQKLDDLEQAIAQLQKTHDDDEGEQSIQLALIAEHKDKLAMQKKALADIDLQIQTQTDKKQRIGGIVQQIRNKLDRLYGEKQVLDNRMAILCANHDAWQKNCVRLQNKMREMVEPTCDIDETLIAQLKEKINQLQPQIDAQNEMLLQKKDDFDQKSQLQQQLMSEFGVLDKQHATYQAEYNTIHALLYKTDQPTRSVQENQRPLAKLGESLTLTALGRRYADRLDALFALFWQDFVGVLADCLSDLPKSLWFVCDEADVHPASRHASIIAVNDLVQHPSLQIFSQLFIVHDGHDDNAGQSLDWQNIHHAEDCIQLFQQLSLPSTAFLLLPDNRLLSVMGCFVLDGKHGDALQIKEQQMARLATLEEMLGDIENQMEILNQRIKHGKLQCDELNGEMADLTRHLKALNFEHQSSQEAYAKWINRQEKQLIYAENYQRQQDEMRQEHQLIDDEIHQMAQQKQQINEELKVLLERLADDEHVYKQHQQEMMAVDEALTQCWQKQKIAQDDMQKSEQILATAYALIDRIEVGRVHYDDKMRMLMNSHEAVSNQIPKQSQAFQLAKKTLNDKAQALELLDNQLTALYHEQKAWQQTQLDEQSKLDEANEVLASLRADMAVATARMNDIMQALQALDETLNLASLLADFDHVNFDKSTIGNIDELVHTQKDLARQIAQIGAVNLTAKSELDELNARLLPMNEQIKDIKNSIDKLNKAISEIDGKTKSLFLASLEAINEELNRLFVRVFGGGQASLQLMEDDSLSKADKWQAGLVLMAQPKGKKNSRLALLSGGEKTLTALSLIFAIFKQNPAPFCVLDEVDAPLDDANVARFTDLIGELSQNVQFIFISHNKLAMQVAQELMGITMPTAGISALVSVDLDEVAHMIEN